MLIRRREGPLYLKYIYLLDWFALSQLGARSFLLYELFYLGEKIVWSCEKNLIRFRLFYY